MAERILIFGTGGLAKEIGQLVRRIDPEGRRWKSLSYVAARASDKGATLPFGKADYSDDDLASLGASADAVIAIADPTLRCQIAKRHAASQGLNFPNLVHPD